MFYLYFILFHREVTKPEEELNLRSQINFFTNPKFVYPNMYLTVGMVMT